MSSNFDREWPEKLNRKAEEKRKKMQEIKIPDDSIDGYKSAEEERYEMQEAFDRFHKSKEWNMICMIYEAGDCLDIVIRDEENIKYRKYRCLYGHGWKKSYLTPEQLNFIQAEQRELEQQRKQKKENLFMNVSKLFQKKKNTDGAVSVAADALTEWFQPILRRKRYASCAVSTTVIRHSLFFIENVAAALQP